MKTARGRRTPEEVLAFRYPIVVRELGPEEGGGWVAMIPQLGARTFVAVGDTREEALGALDALREYLIPQLLEEGVELPEPDYSEEESVRYSGRLVLRLPRELHAKLAERARRNGCSLNQLIVYLLAENLERETLLHDWFVRLQSALARTAAGPASTPGYSEWVHPKDVGFVPPRFESAPPGALHRVAARESRYAPAS